MKPDTDGAPTARAGTDRRETASTPVFPGGLPAMPESPIPQLAPRHRSPNPRQPRAPAARPEGCAATAARRAL
ncbi:hypothetical protein SAMN04488021_102113 [Paracoccus aminovorans]|uniref:Uncharacterized protein n=1 Tax=Paracoccus aminovorans TaxID=34004 RepID=A0A1I2XUH2_9RHOB|nr:hypothetical protein JCM7685_2682 [Paracoccus aminovorans]SFH17045.1 hypothetical protein SAMN04488021_102113 [Paracoccus aminovorans]